MNFFAQQERARRKTFWLVGLLIAAVISLIAVTVLAVTTIFYFSQASVDSVQVNNLVNQPFAQQLGAILRSDLIYWIAFGTLLLVGGGSFYKALQLGGNGRKVAEALGGRQILPNTNDPNEKKVLNVVEEMAIASGNPVPQVYLMEDGSINAFAAGTDRRNAVIGVTRGCVDLLSRDELQGVIAHEFSHIHFGDMRLNIRLVSILHGILLLGLIGSYLLRSAAYSRRGRNAQAYLGMGLLLVVLGYIGVFFGNLIKAAVSRQREFLADASAVQFTRNPAGIANALKKIGGLSEHGQLSSPTAAQFSHFYFAQGIRSYLGGLTATHPPLEARVKCIEPNWDGKMIRPTPEMAAEPSTSEGKRAPQAGGAGGITAASVATMAAISEIGNLSDDNLTQAQNLLQQMPSVLYDAAHEPFSARALVYGLLLDHTSEEHREKQVALLRDRAHPATFKAFSQMSENLRDLPREQYLPLLDLAMPSLKAQSPQQYSVFKKNLAALIKSDAQITLFEWCLYRTVTYGCEDKTQEGQKKLKSLGPEVNVVMNAIFQSADSGDWKALAAAATKELPDIELHQIDGLVTHRTLDTALARLGLLRPLAKPQLLKAIAAAIYANQKVTAEEAELFRAIAETLNCPVPLPPPLLYDA